MSGQADTLRGRLPLADPAGLKPLAGRGPAVPHPESGRTGSRSRLKPKEQKETR